MVRRVASERGAKWFGLPIGSIVTPDKEDEAKARHGNRALPPGAVTGSNQRRAGDTANKDKEEDFQPKGVKGKSSEDSAANSGGNEDKGPLSTRGMKKSPLTGPVDIFVGTGKFSAPEGSKIYKSPQHTGRVYVVTPDNQAFVFTSNGVLDLTQDESTRLAAQVIDRLKADSREEVIEPKDDDKAPATIERLQSLINLIEQAEAAGNTAIADDLMAEFRQKSNELYPEEDPRKVRTRLKASLGGS